MNNLKRILVLGIGNEILTDDGIGPKIVTRLKEYYSSLSIQNTAFSIVFENLFIGGLGILEYIQGYDTVIIIDAIMTRGGIPGDIYQFTPDDFKETLHLSSFHDTSFLTALKFGDKLGFHIPEKIHIIAIEIIEDRTFSNEFTQPLKDRYEEIFEKVKEIIKTKIEE